ncbi:hypothetical protein OG389_24075 [Streptomyces sp. NBC_00435]
MTQVDPEDRALAVQSLAVPRSLAGSAIMKEFDHIARALAA